MLDTVVEGVYHTDLDRRVLYWNASSGRLTGFEPLAVVGQRCQDRIVRHVDGRGTDLCETDRCPLLAALTVGDYQADLYLHHREGHLVPVQVRTEAYADASGLVTGITQVFSPRPVPVTKHTHDWKRVAKTDALTGLGNRRAFRDGWARAHRALVAKGTVAGILMVDIDFFKRVNDELGHAVGDKVLRMVARTIAGCVRNNDVAVRWGGEEFLVLVSGATPETLSALAERIRQLVGRGWVTYGNGAHRSVTVSVGGALVQPDDTSERAINRADERLFGAKAAGRNRSLVGE